MKKFLKTLGIASLVVCSLFTLTACTQNESQKNSNKQNIETKKELTKEEVFNLLQEAETRLLVNYNDCWDSLKLDKDKADNVKSIEYIKAKDGEYVQYVDFREDNIKDTIYCYDFSCDFNANGVSYVDMDRPPYHEYTWSGVNRLLWEIDFTFERGLSIEQIVNYEIKSDGKIEICFVIDETQGEGEYQTNYRTYYVYEIKDRLLLSAGRFSTQIAENVEYSAPIDTTIIEYGAANRDKIELMYQQAKDYIASQN